MSRRDAGRSIHIENGHTSESPIRAARTPRTKHTRSKAGASAQLRSTATQHNASEAERCSARGRAILYRSTAFSRSQVEQDEVWPSPCPSGAWEGGVDRQCAPVGNSRGRDGASRAVRKWLRGRISDSRALAPRATNGCKARVGICSCDCLATAQIAAALSSNEPKKLRPAQEASSRSVPRGTSVQPSPARAAPVSAQLPALRRCCVSMNVLPLAAGSASRFTFAAMPPVCGDA